MKRFTIKPFGCIIHSNKRSIREKIQRGEKDETLHSGRFAAAKARLGKIC
jgi:hypothetical protein